MFARPAFTVALVAGLFSAVCATAAPPVMSKKAFDEARERMVKEDIIGAGVKNRRVIESLRTTLRHEFVPLNIRHRSYLDMALAIGDSQTISSPYIVAFMTEQIDPQPTDRVLEIGTGSGYQAAILSGLVKEVYTIEIVEPLSKKATQTLKRLGYTNVFTKAGDGFQGWKEHAPFDKMIVTCSPEKVPQPLIDQLREGGQIVVPVGQRYQQTMYRYTKKDGKLVAEALQSTYFVPMTGTAESQRKVLPDPSNPRIANGSFEEIEKDGPPTAWYYGKQFSVVTENPATGKRCALFKNETPGRSARALQGFPVDGRKVKFLDLYYKIRGEQIEPGDTPEQLPVVAITFFDERRAPLNDVATRSWRGTFAWTDDSARFPVPPKAREASIYIGLLGATGQLYLDAIIVKPGAVKPGPAGK